MSFPKPGRARSSHAKDRLPSIRKMKKQIAKEVWKPKEKRFLELAAKAALKKTSKLETAELGKLMELRRLTCDCNECMKTYVSDVIDYLTT